MRVAHPSGSRFFAVTCAMAAAVLAGGFPPSNVAAESAPAAAASGEAFDVLEFRILGNSVLPALDIENAVYEFLGPERTLAVVEEARAALERLYRDRGYGTVYVDIPEQSVTDGVVRLRVTEGRLDRVRVSGARYSSSRELLAAVPSVEPGAVLRLTDLQEDLARLNRQSPNRVVTPVLRAGREPGTVDAELRIQDTLPLHASAEINNRYSADTTETRLNLNAGYDNLFDRQHRLSLQFQTAPEATDEARVLAATYVAPLHDGRDYVAGYFVSTDSDVATVGTLSVLGEGQIYGLRYVRGLPVADRFSHGLTFGVDYKDFREDVRLSADAGLVTPIDYLNWSLAYAGNVGHHGGVSAFSLVASFGIRGLANEPREFADKRFKARPNYSYLRTDLQHERPLWAGTVLFLRLSGQAATEPLISNEQFSIGGASSVRGYLESEILGDYGYSASVELRSPSFAGALGDWGQALYVLGFADAGSAWILDPLPEQVVEADLSSVGVGLRFAGLGGFDAALDWAYPLVPGSRTLDGDSRVHFLVRYGF